MTRTAIVVGVLLVGSLPQTAAGQHPDRFGVHAVVPLYEESDLHRGGGGSWRKQIGRGWGLHAVYDVSTPSDHWDHAASVWVAKSFGPPDDAVPYLLVGGAAIGYHTIRRGRGRSVGSARDRGGADTLERPPELVLGTGDPLRGQRTRHALGDNRVRRPLITVSRWGPGRPRP